MCVIQGRRLQVLLHLATDEWYYQIRNNYTQPHKNYLLRETYTAPVTVNTRFLKQRINRVSI